MEVREPKRFVLLDFYRFIAALGVFIFHLKNIDKGISPAWSITAELLCYVIFPLFML
jgi:peptidoglycan/LPS O-acetylase OafA/YrhL